MPSDVMYMKDRDDVRLKRDAAFLYQALVRLMLGPDRTQSVLSFKLITRRIIALYDSLVYDLAQKERAGKQKRSSQKSTANRKSSQGGNSDGGWPPDPPGPILVYIGQLIKRYREDRHLTQAELAEMINTDPTSVSRHERGRGLNIINLQVYAQAFGIEVSDMLPRYGKSVFDLIFTFVQEHGYSYEDTDTFLKYMNEHFKKHRFLPTD